MTLSPAPGSLPPTGHIKSQLLLYHKLKGLLPDLDGTLSYPTVSAQARAAWPKQVKTLCETENSEMLPISSLVSHTGWCLAHRYLNM